MDFVVHVFCNREKENDEVMPEWHGAPMDQNGKIELAACEEIEKRTEVLVGYTDKAKKTTKKGSLQPEYMANCHMLQDHDHMLKLSTGCVGLAAFEPKIPVGALGPHEVRYRTNPEHLPADLRNTMNGRQFRSSIEDTVSGKTRNECGWIVCRQSEWTVLDQGSTGWPAKMIQYYYWGLRGSECPDPIHRRIRIWHNSATESGLHFVKAEYEIVFGYFHAPFGSNGNYNQAVRAFKQMHTSFTFKFFLFQMLYPWIVFAQHDGMMPAGFGTEEHQNEVWEGLPLATFLKNIGTMCARNRWFE
jgi:hypothetical protein